MYSTQIRRYGGRQNPPGRPISWGNPVLQFLRLSIAIGAFWYVAVDGIAAFSSTKWPTVTGQIVDKQIKTVKAHRLFYKDRYEPSVKYKFSVAGKDYVSERIQFGSGNFEKAEAQTILDKYKSKVAVHYNPQDPSECCLDGNVNYSGFGVTLLLGLGMIVLMIFDPKPY